MGEGEETRSSVQAAIEWDLEKFDAIAIFLDALASLDLKL